MNELKLPWIAGLHVLAMVLGLLSACNIQKSPVIKVGILHSLTGTMAMSEAPVVDALTLAIEEINESGGLLGRQIKAVVADGASDNAAFAHQANYLLKEEKVAAIFGCWTSISRKTVKPIIEAEKSLLFYPVQYEGLENSPNIIYTGATPNQQIVPAVHWALENLGKRVYLVGSDYIFPRTANVIINDLLKNRDITSLGERYLPLGSTDVQAIIEDIKRLKPDVIFNSINGDSNRTFFKQLHENSQSKVLSFSIGETEVQSIGADVMVGHYAAWNYFQSINNEENTAFVKKFKQRFGQNRVISDPMEAAYISMKLWAQAVTASDSIDVNLVKSALASQSLNAPQGVVSVDGATQHLWKNVHIGQADKNGQFKIVWSSNHLIRPVPFLTYRTPLQWLNLIKGAQ